jgi:hypothetical protein
MNVNQLVDLLAQAIADGHGNDQVFVNLDQGRFDARACEVLDDHNWAAYEVDSNDGRSGFVGINARPERER